MFRSAGMWWEKKCISRLPSWWFVWILLSCLIYLRKGYKVVPERPRWQYPDLPWRKSKGTSRSATRTVKEIALWSNSKFQFLQHNKVMSTFRHVFWTQDTCWTLLESYLYVFEYIQHALMQLQLKNKLGPSSCPLRLQHSPFQPESWLWSVDLNSRAAIFYR